MRERSKAEIILRNRASVPMTVRVTGFRKKKDLTEKIRTWVLSPLSLAVTTGCHPS